MCLLTNFKSSRWPLVRHSDAALRLSSYQFDKEGTGFVEEPEIRRMLKQIAPADEVDEMMSLVNVEMDGTINYVEFTRKMIHLS